MKASLRAEEAVTYSTNMRVFCMSKPVLQFRCQQWEVVKQVY